MAQPTVAITEVHYVISIELGLVGLPEVTGGQLTPWAARQRGNKGHLTHVCRDISDFSWAKCDFGQPNMASLSQQVVTISLNTDQREKW